MPSLEQEEEYLRELMAEFRVADAPPVSEALYLVQERYRMLWSRLLGRTIRFEPPYVDLRNEDVQEVVAEAEKLVTEIHRFLFVGILSNAGTYRSASDTHEGAVWFGGHDRFYRQVGRFQGSTPQDIETDVRSAVQAFCRESYDPLRAACAFYQRFVRTHPFYDANGRIARLVAALLLRAFGLEVRWSEMENKNNEFIRRLNAVHKHESNPNPYLTYLTSYVSRFTHEIETSSDAIEE